MRPPAASRTDPVGSTVPPSRSAHSSGSRFTLTSSGASQSDASAMRRAVGLAVGLRPALQTAKREY